MINFKKIASYAASTFMIGSTVALAAASSFPTPFINNGAADAVVVQGSSTAAIADLAAVNDIQLSLNSEVTSTGGQVQACDDSSLGESCFRIARPNTEFQLGKGILDVVSGTLTDSDLGTLLADGIYLDSQNAQKDYTQKVVLGNLSLTLFEDSGYKADIPTVGFNVPSGTHVLNYTLDFTDRPNWADMANTDINILGKDYFVSSVTTNTTLNLLDAAETTIITGGESSHVTIDGVPYDITIKVMDSNGVIFDVNGVTTNKISTGQTYQLADGAYIGLKDYVNPSRETDSQYAEVSIGTGKIELTDGNEIKINEKTYNDLSVNFVNSNSQLDKIVITWNAREDMFITEDSVIKMPGFDGVELSFTGMTFPTEEAFTIKGTSTYLQLKSFPLKSGVTDIDLLYGNGTDFTGTGKKSGNGLLSTNGSSMTFDSDLYDYFVATYDDGTDAESYLMRATSFSSSSGTNTTTIQYKKDGSFINAEADAEPGEVNIGSVSITLGAINKNDKTVVISAGTNVNFNTVYSDGGLEIFLPWAHNVANYTLDPGSTGALQVNTSGVGWSASTYSLTTKEEDKNGIKAGGNTLTYTIGWASSKVSVTGISGESPDGGIEVENSNNLRSFAYSPLATEMLYKTGGDQEYVDVVYHGDESYGNVFFSGSSTSSGDSSLNVLIVKDSNTEGMSGKNLVVVGGSCVNKLAADTLNVAFPTCGAGWTTATGAGAGEYVIQTFENSGKVATIVAGWEAEDTANAATFFTTQNVDTSVGMKYIGTTGTEATLVTA